MPFMGFNFLAGGRKSKSQTSAPIELFVAVIILAMTLALGFKIMGDVEEGKCVSKLQTETQQLKNAMIDVALGSSGTKRTVYFEFPSCGSKKIEGLQFVLYQKPEYCKLCPGTYGHCWQIVPVARDPTDREKFIRVTDAISCVNMAGDIQISTTDCPSSTIFLSDNPCFDDPTTTTVVESDDSYCRTNSKNFGVLESVLKADISSWSTLGAGKERALYIDLTKTVALATSAGEKGAIQLCAKAP